MQTPSTRDRLAYTRRHIVEQCCTVRREYHYIYHTVKPVCIVANMQGNRLHSIIYSLGH